MSKEKLAIEEILRALDECFDGESKFGGVFLEPEDPGLMSMLTTLNAKEASMPIAGMSIANHVYHLIFALDVFIKRIKGDESATNVDWNTSWQELSLDETGWEQMRENFICAREEAVSLARNYNDNNAGYEKHLRLVMGLLTHTVFHLGIIRVKFDERLKW